MSERNRERPGKILVAMMALAKGTTKALKYEDIVVRAFELYPDEFALRGYPTFPDSSDIHKPLYGILKRGGLIRSANKTFSLTERGIETARRLLASESGTIDLARKAERMTRDVRTEVDRMLNSAAFSLFTEGKGDSILDTDFYDFIGCTVRTSKNTRIGRADATAAAAELAARLAVPTEATGNALAALWLYLNERFGALAGAK
jgi:hypothetical protein